MGRRAALACAAVILALHGAAALDAARSLSPAWDEIVYPAAGLAQWRRGRVDLNGEHPPLSRLILSATLAAAGAPMRFDGPEWEKRDAYRFGFKFIYRNERPAEELILLSRLPSVVLSVATAALLYVWLAGALGPAAGLAAAAVYAMTPLLQSRASMALLEGPLHFFLAAALAAYGRWRQTGRPAWAAGAGGALGLACACKMTALPGAAALLLAELVVGSAGRSWAARARGLALLAAGGAGATALVYGPWRDGGAALWSAASYAWSQVDAGRPFFWNGQVLREAPSPLTWGIMGIKASPFLAALAAMGAWSWRRSGTRREAWGTLVVFCGAYLACPALLKTAQSAVQMSPLFLGLAGLAGGVGLLSAGRAAWAAGALAALGLVDAALVHPNAMAYISPLAGGSRAGVRWIGDSDQDWGQWLPALADHLKREAAAGRGGETVLCYAGAGDPAAHGIPYRDLFSPALVTRDRPQSPAGAADGRVLLAVGTKVLQSEPRLMGWLSENRKPSAVPDPCVFVYDATGDAEVFRWMGFVYLATRRPDGAAWAFGRAARAAPGDPEDARILAALAKEKG